MPRCASAWSGSFAAGGSTTSASWRRWPPSPASGSSRARTGSGRTPTRRCRSASTRRSRSPTWWRATAELLGVSGDENVLEVGTGSGYAAAVLAELAQSVTSIERVPELADAGARRALAETGYGRVEVVVGDGSLGFPDRAPFHAIAVAAAAAHAYPTASTSSWPRVAAS